MEDSGCPKCGLHDGWDGNGCNNCGYMVDTDGGVDYLCPVCAFPTYDPLTKKCSRCDSETDHKEPEVVPDLSWEDSIILQPGESDQTLPTYSTGENDDGEL